jgi:hypothetical protein
VVGRHVVVALQQPCEPAAGGQAVEAEAVGGLGEQGVAAGGVEARLEILHEIEARAARRRAEHGVGRFPRGREDRVGVVDAIGGAADLGAEPGPAGAHPLPVALERPAVAIVQVDRAAVPCLFE